MTDRVFDPRRRLVLGLVLSAGLTRGAQAGSAGRLNLLMVRRPGCAWCARWDSEIGPVYARHPEGRQAPLIAIDADGPYPDGLALARLPWLTPSFILLQDRAEIARYEGYPGAARFFAVLRDMIAEAGRPA